MRKHVQKLISFIFLETLDIQKEGILHEPLCLLYIAALQMS